MVAAWAGVVGGLPALGSALAGAVLVILPNLLLKGLLAWAAPGWGVLVLMAGKLAGLFASVVGLVWLSQVWLEFDWVWALLDLAAVVTVWLAAPLVLSWAQRQTDLRKIDEIVARMERSPRN